MTEPVGIVGLGVMGGAIIRNIAASQRKAIGFDIDAQRMREATTDGIDVEASVAALAERVPVLITSLPSPRVPRGSPPLGYGCCRTVVAGVSLPPTWTSKRVPAGPPMRSCLPGGTL